MKKMNKITNNPPEIIEVDPKIIEDMKARLIEAQLKEIIENDPLGVL